MSSLIRETFVLEMLHSAQGTEREKDISSFRKHGGFSEYAYVFELYKANPGNHQNFRDVLKGEMNEQAERLASFLALKRYLASGIPAAEPESSTSPSPVLAESNDERPCT